MTPASDGSDLVLWHVSARQTVLLPRESADWILEVSEAYDAIPFAWGVTGGWMFALMPRNLWKTEP